MPNWQIKEYSFSAGLYHRICTEYSILGIYFISSAQKRFVSDNQFLSITGNIPTTIKRKQDWMKPGMKYEAFLRLYLLEKVREAIK